MGVGVEVRTQLAAHTGVARTLAAKRIAAE
jgi:hypothetical protein